MVYTIEHIKTKLDKDQTNELTYHFHRCRNYIQQDKWLKHFGVNIDEYLDACELYDLVPETDIMFREIAEVVAINRQV